MIAFNKIPRRFPFFAKNYRNFATVYESFTAVKYEKLKLENSGIAVIALDNPKNKNALSATLVREVNTILDDIYYDSNIRVVVLRSLISGVFCAGKQTPFAGSVCSDDLCFRCRLKRAAANARETGVSLRFVPTEPRETPLQYSSSSNRRVGRRCFR